METTNNNSKLAVGQKSHFSKIASKVWWNCEVLFVTESGYVVRTETGEQKDFKFSHEMRGAKKSSDSDNNQPKHTQGEWLIRTKEENFSRKVTDFKGSLLANVFADTDEEAEANAKLIASAPYLLEALKSTLNTETESGMCSFIIGGKIHSEIILAIKKATE